MTPWLMLVAAITAEVIGTLALRASDGFTRLVPSAVVVAGYGVAFYLLAQALRTIGVGPAYATWSGLGTIGAAVGARLVFDERMSGWTLVGMVMIVVGVAVMFLLSETAHG